MSDFSVYRPQFPELLAKTLQPGNKVPHTSDHVARLNYNCPANFIAPPQLITIVPPLLSPNFNAVRQLQSKICPVIIGIDYEQGRSLIYNYRW